MPRSQMAYDASATPLRRIFPQVLAMIVQFYGAGKAAAAITDPAATADSLTAAPMIQNPPAAGTWYDGRYGSKPLFNIRVG